MARATLVLSADEIDNSEPNATMLTTECSKESHGGNSSISKKSHSSTRSLFNIRRQFEKKGFSAQSTEIMLQARRASTTKTNEAP